jgi:hypothetical protein
MYGTMVVRADVDRPTLLRCLAPFQTGMMWIAWIVIGQQIVQYTIGNRYWPNLDTVIPSSILLQGYSYLRPYAWNSPYLTPNGIFFLEPSAVSSFMALALAAEAIWFGRLRRMVLFGVALLAGIAATGPAVIALFSPALLVQMDRRLRRFALGLSVPLLALAAASGAFSHLIDRSDEFVDAKSSAYARFVVPLDSTLTLLADPAYLLSGNGPGTSPKGSNEVQWPINKLTYEYGFLSALVFHAFVLFAMLAAPASRTLALIVLVPHLLFGGGFVSHTNLMMLVLFGSLLRVPPAPRLPSIYLDRQRAIAAG